MATASASTISLSNRALLQIGSRTSISSLTEGSPQANACNVLFVPVFEQLGRAARWATLRKQATLSLLAAATGTPENPNGTTLPLPPTPWLYSYQYPADCLAMRNIVPSLPASPMGVPFTSASVASPIWLPSGGQIPFEVAYSTDIAGNPITVILTNQSQAQAVYTVDQPNPVIWDSLFQQAFVSGLAAFLVPALALNIPLMQGAIAAAEKMIMTARTADGNAGVTSQNREADWMRARSQGVSVNGCGNAINYCEIDVCWPCG